MSSSLPSPKTTHPRGFRWMLRVLMVFVMSCGAIAFRPAEAPAVYSANMRARGLAYENDPETLAPGPCASCKPVVLKHFQGPPGLSAADVEQLATNLTLSYGIPVSYGGSFPLPKGSFNSKRQQFDATRMLPLMESMPDARVIAVTSDDIYMSLRPEWRYTFGSRLEWIDSGVAVISTARMRGSSGSPERRLAVMVGKYIATLGCGFATSDDPRSVVYHNILSERDLDTMSKVVCSRTQ